MAVGGGILWVIGWVGSRIYGRDAMGLGDVKLLAAGGGFLGPCGVLWALMVASLVASVPVNVRNGEASGGVAVPSSSKRALAIRA